MNDPIGSDIALDALALDALALDALALDALAGGDPHHLCNEFGGRALKGELEGLGFRSRREAGRGGTV